MQKKKILRLNDGGAVDGKAIERDSLLKIGDARRKELITEDIKIILSSGKVRSFGPDIFCSSISTFKYSNTEKKNNKKRKDDCELLRYISSLENPNSIR